MVASSFALDQFLATQPSYFFDASPERARVNPGNLYILVNHVKCAAFELPFRAGTGSGRLT
jgi:Distinct helicase family with a unique C-terminal domain including a metal-binding cysteine cluster